MPMALRMAPQMALHLKKKLQTLSKYMLPVNTAMWQLRIQNQGIQFSATIQMLPHRSWASET